MGSPRSSTDSLTRIPEKPRCRLSVTTAGTGLTEERRQAVSCCSANHVRTLGDPSMARAAKRQTEAARLRERLESAMEVGEQRRLEINELRKAGQQVMEGLKQYAMEENWKIEGTLTDDGHEIDRYVWKQGDGMAIARKFLGLDNQEERN